jgi:prepilin-type N-terminal cleavage/methylation domain-containing protein
MISLKRKQSGFTIVELLIVIVVIGILVALVVTTFSGIQRKARNTERESDVKAIHSQLEAYFNEAGAYPALGGSGDGINDSSWRATNMKSLDAEALKDPKGTGQALCAEASDTCYGYAVGEDNATYTLTANLEGGGTYEKQNLN